MKNKKIFMFLIIILLIIFILAIGLVLNSKNKKREITDYTPEQEISDEQFRMTNIKLYFFNTETNQIEEEIRQIDSMELLDKPEEKIIKLLLQGSKKENLTNILPENTNFMKLNNNNGVLEITFSLEIENMKTEKRKILEELFSKTLLQLNEINEVKIIIEKEQ